MLNWSRGATTAPHMQDETEAEPVGAARPAPRVDAVPSPSRSTSDAPWRMLMREAALEIEGSGALRSFTCGGQVELAPLIDAVGEPLADRLRPGDRVLWLHSIARLRAGEPTVSIDVALRLDAAGREWRDVSMRLAAQGEAIVALAAIRAIDGEAGDDGLAELAHELRTPLNAVIGYARALEAGLFGTLSERQRDAVIGIVDASEHLVEVANTVLDAARLDVGADIEPVAAPIAPAIARACAMVSGVAARRDVTVANRVTERAGTLEFDPAALRQIVVNLVSNGVKASETGSVVTIEARRTVRDGGAGVEITVEDRGCGMTADELARLGRRFARGTRCAGETTGGLGLPLVQRLVARHGGTLGFSSQPGEGTRACVFLPAGADRTEHTEDKGSAAPLRLTA